MQDYVNQSVEQINTGNFLLRRLLKNFQRYNLFFFKFLVNLILAIKDKIKYL